MTSKLRTRMIVISAVVLICLLGLFCFRKGSGGEVRFSFPTSFEQLAANLESRVNLGLDLQGGMHLILQVQVDEAINAETDQLAESLPALLREQGIGFQTVRKPDPRHVQIAGIPDDQVGTARTFLQDTYTRGTVHLTHTHPGGYTLGSLSGEASGFALELNPSFATQIRQETVRAAIDILRQRIDSLGVSEPTIAEHGRGEWEILVQLPGVDDPARVKNILQSTAMLEIKLVEDGPFVSDGEALARSGGILPQDTVLMRANPQVHAGHTHPGQWYVLSRTSVVAGRDLRSARAQPSPDNPGYEVSFTLSRDGAARFGPFTERNIGRPLAIVLDNRIQSVANIQSRIDDSGRITGSFALQQASDLALVLRSGALPASIKYLEERTVGPSLGADSIRAGLTAIVAGFVAVMAFMLVYYRLSGVNAVVSLVLNLLILMAALAYIGATLTLPGIAGILLTIGMAVDANVLVFERIREELRAGKRVLSAVETGFNRAFTTIFDTNTTTIIAAIFLFMFGTGAIKGFAVTLTIGLFANIFTAVYVSRAIFEFVLSRQARVGARQSAILSI